MLIQAAIIFSKHQLREFFLRGGCVVDKSKGRSGGVHSAALFGLLRCSLESACNV
jgi:hypothetical protein